MWNLIEHFAVPVLVRKHWPSCHKAAQTLAEWVCSLALGDGVVHVQGMIIDICSDEFVHRESAVQMLASVGAHQVCTRQHNFRVEVPLGLEPVVAAHVRANVPKANATQ